MAETIERQVNQKGQDKLIVTDPEYTISIIGLIASICGQPLVGLVMSIMAMKRSKLANRANIYAFLGFVFSLILIAMYVLFLIAYIGIIAVGVATHNGRAF